VVTGVPPLRFLCESPATLHIGPQFSIRVVTLSCLTPANTNLVERLRSGDARALARAITTVENHAAGWSELLKSLFPYTGKSRIIGLTGAPGAGKSTLVDQLAKHYRKQNRSIGIVAVDPTSPYTGGAILGDRIRTIAIPEFISAAWPREDRSADFHAPRQT